MSVYLIVNGIEGYKDEWIYIVTSFVDTFIIIWFVRYWKFISMPYALNLFGKFIHNTFLGLRDKRTVFLDFFVSKKGLTVNLALLKVFYKIIGFHRFKLYYFNPIAISKEGTDRIPLFIITNQDFY